MARTFECDMLDARNAFRTKKVSRKVARLTFRTMKAILIDMLLIHIRVFINHFLFRRYFGLEFFYDLIVVAFDVP